MPLIPQPLAKKPHRFSVTAAVALFGLFLLHPSAGRAASPTADEMIPMIVARDKQLQQQRKGYDYDLDITHEKLDSNRVVTQTTHDHSVVIGDHRPDYNANVGKGKSDGGSSSEAKEEPFDLLKILDRYTYSLDGQEAVDGVLCYKIGFTPKPDLPYHNRQEKVLNAVSGHLWASVKDYSLIRTEGTLMNSVSVGWIFATLEELDFKSDTMPLPNGDYGPKEVQYRYLVALLFGHIHERDTRQNSSYRATK
jgi:hypothetical protein